jgi:hypothetical protein
VRERAPEEHAVEHPRKLDIVDVLAIAGQDAAVFHPPNTGTDEPLGNTLGHGRVLLGV